MNSRLAAAELTAALETAASDLPASLDYLDRILVGDDLEKRLGVALACARTVVVGFHLDEVTGGDFIIAVPTHADGRPASIDDIAPADTFAARMIVSVANQQYDTAVALHQAEAAHNDFFRYVAGMRQLFTAAATALQQADR